MYLPQEAEQVLRENVKFCFNDKFIVIDEDAEWFEANLGLKNSNSSFISFYTLVAFPPVGNGSELLTLDSIMENAEYDQQEFPDGIGTRYLRFTSSEGEASYYFDVVTDKVYDVAWGEEEDLMNGKHPILFSTFFSFLQNYYKKT
ncbi:hypothetical protein [Psychromonas ossibalaenae]|uniref:hypothetical protein n=1 Tax=Psychromonas ossibalaenae TaxID=444922 RepID=UPI000368015A|nr:hypothetical protein [Psychromonas ossibalaenae]